MIEIRNGKTYDTETGLTEYAPVGAWCDKCGAEMTTIDEWYSVEGKNLCAGCYDNMTREEILDWAGGEHHDGADYI